MSNRNSAASDGPPSRLCAVVVVLGLAWPTAAAADDEPFTIGSQPAWFLMAGATGGGTVGLDTRGAFAGGELSLARVQDRSFFGAYIDGYYDFGIDATYLTFGPEAGIIRRSRTLPLAFGVDGGAAFRFADGTDIGGTARAFVTVAGALSLYTRYVHFGSETDDRMIQVGLAIKYPLWAPFGAGTR